jgi:hypothetical protein
MRKKWQQQMPLMNAENDHPQAQELETGGGPQKLDNVISSKSA